MQRAHEDRKALLARDSVNSVRLGATTKLMDSERAVLLERVELLMEDARVSRAAAQAVKEELMEEQGRNSCLRIQLNDERISHAITRERQKDTATYLLATYSRQVR